jgi:hypothetical protein
MSPIARILLAAAVVALVGCQSPTTTPTQSQAAGVDLQAGDLDPGTRYRASRRSDTGSVGFSFIVPTAGWSYDGFEVIRHPDSPQDTRLWFFLTSSMYSDAMPFTPAVFDDPCAHGTLQAFDASLAGQAEALVSIPGTERVSGPTEVTIGSRPGQAVAIVLPADLGCANSDFWLLFNASCGTPKIDCSNYPNWPGEALREWLIDVNDEILNVRAQLRDAEAGAELDAEIQDIVDSIQFD